MADLTITEANVTSSNASQTYRSYQCEVAITAGQVVRINGTTGKLILAQADSAENADMLGIALSGAGIDGYIVVAESSGYVSGATMVAGKYYVVSNTAGALAPFTDLTTGQFTTYAIYATSTTEAVIRRVATGIAVA